MFLSLCYLKSRHNPCEAVKMYFLKGTQTYPSLGFRVRGVSAIGVQAHGMWGCVRFKPEV